MNTPPADPVPGRTTALASTVSFMSLASTFTAVAGQVTVSDVSCVHPGSEKGTTCTLRPASRIVTCPVSPVTVMAFSSPSLAV